MDRVLIKNSSLPCSGAVDTLNDDLPRGVGRKRHRNKEGRTTTKKKKKPKMGDEAMPSKEKGGKTKLVTWRLSQELIGYLHAKEIMGFIATETPRPLRSSMPAYLFDAKLKEQVIAEFKENREFEADVLYQYRTKGYVEIEEEVLDEDEDV